MFNLEDQQLDGKIKLVDARVNPVENRVLYQKISTATTSIEASFKELEEKFVLIPDSITAPCWGYYDLPIKRKADIDIVAYKIDYGRHGMIRVDYFLYGPSAKGVKTNKQDKT